MKTTKIFSIIALIAAASMAFVSCEDDMSKNFKPAQVGDEIFFGGTAGYEDEARTVYGEKGTTGTPIMWYEGDQVRIYCAEARQVEGKSYCDYKVNNVVPAGGEITTDKTSSTLTSTAAYGLQWGSEAEHKFYGVYPSPNMFAAGSTEANTYQINGKTLTAYLPTNQNPRAYVADTDGNYTIHPAMRYAYMTAYNSATHTADGVTMTFKPIVTAVEITLKNISKITQGTTEVGKAIENISGVRITSPYDNIAGKFTANIVNGTVQSVDENEGKNYVEITVRDENGYPITLESGKTLTFTVFMVLPNEHEGLQDLKVSLLQSGTYKTTNIVKNDGLLVQAQKKNFISPVTINWDTNIEVTMDKWLASIDGNTPLGMLSIPGAGGVGSHLLTDNYSTQQTLDIEALWNSGIRCFELSTDNVSSSTEPSSASSLGGAYLTCNNYKINGMTLEDAVREIQNQLEEHPTEFAIVMITYSPSSVTSNLSTGRWGRQSASWQCSLYKYWGGSNGTSGKNAWNKKSSVQEGITHETKLFSPTLTLDEARGKLFCISRPTAIGGDGWWYSMRANPPKVLPVLGWGPLPDQFYARGYTRTNRPYYISTSNNFTETSTTTGGNNFLFPYYENMGVSDEYTFSKNNTSAHLLESPTYWSSDNKFLYRSCDSGIGIEKFRDDIEIYAQEWRRVVKENITGSYKKSSNWGSTTYYYFWRSNINEKKNDILQALQKATANENPNRIYINSLSGFYVDGSIENSYLPRPHVLRFYAGLNSNTNEFEDIKYSSHYSSTLVSNQCGAYNYYGGTQGDIVSCAKDLNRFFYEELLNLGVENLTGPTGIVMIDRVKDQINSDDDKPGYYLPRFIIENTMRHYGTINDGDIEDSEGI